MFRCFSPSTFTTINYLVPYIYEAGMASGTSDGICSWDTEYIKVCAQEYKKYESWVGVRISISVNFFEMGIFTLTQNASFGCAFEIHIPKIIPVVGSINSTCLFKTCNMLLWEHLLEFIRSFGYLFVFYIKLLGIRHNNISKLIMY